MSENEARFKAEAYCSMAEHCRAEVMEKLYQWGVSPECMDGILNHLGRQAKPQEEPVVEEPKDKKKDKKKGGKKISRAGQADRTC